MSTDNGMPVSIVTHRGLRMVQPRNYSVVEDGETLPDRLGRVVEHCIVIRA